MTVETERAAEQAWKAYAEACLQHDCVMGQHACEDLQALAAACPPVVIPTQGT